MNRFPDPCGRRRGLLVAKACKLCAANVRPALDPVQARRIVAQLSARLAAHGTRVFWIPLPSSRPRGAGGRDRRSPAENKPDGAREKIKCSSEDSCRLSSFFRLRGEFCAGTFTRRTEALVSCLLARWTLFLAPKRLLLFVSRRFLNLLC